MDTVIVYSLLNLMDTRLEIHNYMGDYYYVHASIELKTRYVTF